MANMFGKTKEVYEMQKKAMAIQKALKDLEVEAASSDGELQVAFNGNLHLTKLSIGESWLVPAKRRDLEKELTKIIGQAVGKAQEEQAKEAQKLMGDLKLPGLS